MRASTSLRAMVAIGLLIAACTPGPVASPTPAPTGVGVASPLPTSAATVGPSVASQNETAWGRIWDALPTSFPRMEGTQPATDTGEGASSGQLAVPAKRDAVVEFYRQALRELSYSIGTDGPLEDGSVTVTASAGAYCRIQLTVRGSATRESMVTVMYGAGCPLG